MAPSHGIAVAACAEAPASVASGHACADTASCAKSSAAMTSQPTILREAARIFPTTAIGSEPYCNRILIAFLVPHRGYGLGARTVAFGRRFPSYTCPVMKRARRAIIGLLGIAAILFAQAVTAAYACRMTLAAANAPGAAVSTPCDDDADNPVLCLKHCHDEPQKAQDAYGDGPPAVFVPIVALAAAPRLVPHGLPAIMPSLLHAPPLALSIRNCCFRI